MILIENGVVIAIMDTYEQRSNGKFINGSIYPMGEVIDINAPSGVIPTKYSYTDELGFYINEEWKNSKEQIIQDSIDKYTLELIKGGLL